MNTNACSAFQLIALSILLIVPSSVLVDAETKEYPSFVNIPYSWINSMHGDGVKPIVVNGMFVCGLHCTSYGGDCLFAISIYNTTSDRSFPVGFVPTQIVWSGNRNNPFDIQEIKTVLELTSEGELIRKEASDTLVWSPSNVIKSISRLNLSAEGNLMLLNKTNHVVWQSFDHPTDTLVRGQRLLGRKLRASVSPDNSIEGLYAIDITSNGQFRAYLELDLPQIYYNSSLYEVGFRARSQQEFFDHIDAVVGRPYKFIQLGSDGHLKAYGLNELDWEEIDLLDTDPCSYPLACGNYSLCSKERCSCLDDASEIKTTYFKPIDYKKRDSGCRADSPISCELSHYHGFIELQGSYYQSVYNFLFSESIALEDCKEACLRNCSCKAAVYSTYPEVSCYFLSQVLSIRTSDSSDSSYGNSFFIKVQNSPENKRQDLAVIVGSTLGAILGAFLICGLFYLRAEKVFEQVEEYGLDNMMGLPTRFSYEELKNITKNFSIKLGEGGFGSVFHGVLSSGSEVAVKRLFGFGSVNKSFVAEVQTIGSIHHFNLVTLVGFCAENFTRLLVYEYMANGSLDQWIFNKKQDVALGWQVRKKIILDIARGLAYLHEDCNQKIIHLDIKPQNILLDDNFNAKVADFGLSKLIGKDQSQVMTTMRGTPGYMAPEWLSSIITEKVDVYSFGIVVLEILCGRRNIDGSQQEEDRHLLGLFRRKQEEGLLVDLVDKCGDDMESNATEVVEMMKVAAWCLQTEHARRPSMSVVVKLFEGSVDVAGNVNEDFVHGLTLEATEAFASTILPSMLSGPR